MAIFCYGIDVTDIRRHAETVPVIADRI